MSLFEEEKIVNLIKNNNSASFYFLVKKMNISPNKNKEFSLFLKKLKSEGKIAFSKKNDSFYIPKLIKSLNTEIKIKQNNFGFVFFEYEGRENKAIIFKENLNNSINDDVVTVNIYQEFDDSNLFFGIVEKIIERKQKYIFGIINNLKQFEPIGFSNKYEFYFNENEVESNTYVKFKIQSINKNEIHLELVKKISNINSPYSDLEFIIESLHIDKNFNEGVIKETLNIPDNVKWNNEDNRIDLRNELIVTIDGENTKDFDDAINVKKTFNNTFIASIHIADVSFYVKEGSEIDNQALQRGTSIYLLNKVIPMLPEKLSNGICSLNPNVDRFTLSVEIEIDSFGNVLNKKIFPAIINSKYRLTYNQINNYKNEEIFKKNDELYNMIQNAYELSDVLSKMKYNQGYIDFEIEESIVEVNDKGEAISIKNKQRLSSEVLIENLMVLANEVVSKIVADLKYPSIYRIHEAPNEEKFTYLEEVIKILNLKNISVKHSEDPKEFSKLVEQIKKQRFDDFMKITLLRTMQKAKYSIDNIGHFGLAAKYYSHFTSPIRRYPDLILHRLIWELIIKKNINYLDKLEEKIIHAATISSQKEEEALIAERKINDVKKAEYYNKNINKIFEGTIVSIQKFGVFVELEDGANALIHSSRLSNEICEVNENNTCMTCGDKKFKLGEKIKIMIIGINKLEGKIDAQLVV